MEDTVNQMSNNVTQIGQMKTNYLKLGQTDTTINGFDRQLS
jgi:hypothetical protein